MIEMTENNEEKCRACEGKGYADLDGRGNRVCRVCNGKNLKCMSCKKPITQLLEAPSGSRLPRCKECDDKRWHEHQNSKAEQWGKMSPELIPEGHHQAVGEDVIPYDVDNGTDPFEEFQTRMELRNRRNGIDY